MTLSRNRRRASARQLQTRSDKWRLLILNLFVLLRIRESNKHSDAVVLAHWLPPRLSINKNTPLNKVRCYAVEIEIGGCGSGFVASRQHGRDGEVVDHDYRHCACVPGGGWRD